MLVNLELELQIVVSCHLGAEVWSSLRVANALNVGANSQPCVSVILKSAGVDSMFKASLAYIMQLYIENKGGREEENKIKTNKGKKNDMKN